MQSIIQCKNKEYWKLINTFLGKLYEEKSTNIFILAKYTSVKGYKTHIVNSDRFIYQSVQHSILPISIPYMAPLNRMINSNNKNTDPYPHY